MEPASRDTAGVLEIEKGESTSVGGEGEAPNAMELEKKAIVLERMMEEGKAMEVEGRRRKKKKAKVAGVVYLSRVPPFMRPRKVRHLLSKYGSIGRVYLQPEGRLW